MIRKYREYIKEYVVRHANEIGEYRISPIHNVHLPEKSVLHNSVVSGRYPINNSPLMENLNNPFIVNILEYDHVVGATKLKFNERNLVSHLNKKYSTVETMGAYRLNKIVTSNTIRKRVPIINYSLLKDQYKYTPRLNLRHELLINDLKTIVSNVSKLYDKTKEDGIHQFITLELPDALLTKALYEKYMNLDEYTSGILDLLSNKNLVLIELFKMLDVDTKDKSLISEIYNKRTLLNSITLILYKHDKCISFNLGLLVRFNKDIDDNGEITSVVLRTRMFNVIKSLTTSVDVNDIDNTFNIDSIDKSILEEDDILEEVKEIEKDIDIPTDGNIETVSNIYSKVNKDDIIHTKGITNTTNLILDDLLDNGTIDKRKHLKLVDDHKKFLSKKSPYNSNETMGDLLNVDIKDIKLKDADKQLPVPNVLFNAKDATDTISAVDKNFSSVSNKYIISNILEIQKTGLIVKNIEIEDTDDVLGEYTTYTIEINDKGKSSYSVKLLVPKVSDDGVFKISGNHYRLRRQIGDKPIRKINFNRVSLSSSVGKIFVDKAPYKKMDRGYSIRKELVNLSEKGAITNLVAGSSITYDSDIPQIYSEISRYIKSFNYGSDVFVFNFNSRTELFKNVKELEGDKYVVMGITSNKNPILMDTDGYVYVNKKGKLVDKGYILDILDIDATKLKNEYSLVKIHKKHIPVVYVLAYYLGMEGMFKVLNAEYEILEGSKRITRPDIGVKLLDKTILIKPKDETSRMILEGFNFNAKLFKETTLAMVNNKKTFKSIFNKLDLPLSSVTEIDTLEHLFIDTTTRLQLLNMNEPTTFIGLLVRSSELLLDDKYGDPTSPRGYSIKSYDRIPQFIHKTLTDAVKSKTNASHFGNSKLSVDPYAVWKMMNEDSSGILVDDINPIAYLKQKEDTTYLGTGGRGKESMSRSTRKIHADAIGIISEGAKDSGDVGISAYLSTNPLISDGLGNMVHEGELEYSNILSTTNMVLPFATMDDPKRSNYSNIQNSHITPISNAKVYPIRTGYERVLPYKVDGKFVGMAKEEGVVLSLKNNSMEVKYKTLGKVKLKFDNWNNKEESGTSYMHVMVSNVKKGDKFNKDDTLYYDDGFFAPDMFDTTKVLYRAGTFTKVAFNEIGENYEDALLISDKLAGSVKLHKVKSRSILLSNTDEITNYIKVNDKVSSTDSLFFINTGLKDNEKLDKETLNLLEGFVKDTPKAKYGGKVNKIQVFYNCDKSELSKSLLKLVTETSKHIVDTESGKGYSGKVNSSYSIDGKPLEVGKVEVKYFIEGESVMGTGDKGIMGSQLKTTVTAVTSVPMSDESGESVDAIFSYKGVLGRIVTNLDLQGSTATLLSGIGKQAADMYFNDK